LLYRNIRHYGPTEVHAEMEFVHNSVDGMSTIIPYNPSWNKVLVQVSGGLDSALMLYLFAKNLAEQNSKVKIQPLSFEVSSKAKTLATARAVIRRVKTLTNYQHLLDGIEVVIPIEQAIPPYKDAFFLSTIQKIFSTEQISFELNGNNKNPPEEVRVDFRDDEWRQLSRDNRTTIYNSPFSASPHAFNNKKGIVYLYKTENILHELAALTLSCDEDLDIIERFKLPVPCKKCWWCCERAWGFAANNLVDPYSYPSTS
jgi:7-cyano-7-deazaguanine synthase in queuosine biosynthesis